MMSTTRSVWLGPWLALWLTALVLSPAAAQQRACAEHEKCVAITRCESLARLVDKKHTLTADERTRLRDAVCGWDASRPNIPKVCCSIVPLDVCGPRNNPDRIINGNETLVNEFPWAVRLGYRARGRIQYGCGGALISHRYVLTAAHCVEGSRPPVTVRLGEHDIESDVDCSMISGVEVCAERVVDVDVEEIVKHPEYEPRADRPTGLWNDIALVRLRRAVPFTKSVKPVCLPLKIGPQTGISDANTIMTVVGWGRIEQDQYGAYSRYLMKLNLRAMATPQCKEKYKSYPSEVDGGRQLCAIGKDGSDVCSGDSGGPLTADGSVAGKVRAVLHGVVSYGPSVCATNGVPGVFTRVSNYLPWILGNVKFP